MLLFTLLLCLCGSSLGARMSYIIGGEPVRPPGKWPWMGSLQVAGGHGCGAVLISSEWAVSAAHCTLSEPSFYHSIVFGAHDLHTGLLGDPVRFNISQYINHEDFSYDPSRGFPNDISLIKFDPPVPADNEFIAPISLAEEGASFLGNTCYITGWGLISGGYPANILQEAEMSAFTQEECRKKWIEAGDNVINDGHICVGGDEERGACSFDSGGPLMCDVDGTWILAGVTSWGRSDCDPVYPSVYTRISYFRDWIRENSGV